MEKIYYADIETPVGTVWAVQSNKGLMRINFPCEEAKLLADVAKHTKTVMEYRPRSVNSFTIAGSADENGLDRNSL